MSERLVNWLVGVIVSPGETLREIAYAKPVAWGVVIYLVVSVLAGATSNGAIPAHLHLTVTLLSPIFTVITLFIVVGLYHLFARLFKGRGEFWGLFSAVCFAGFVTIFMPPINLLSQVGGIGLGVVTGILSLGIMVWNLVLNVLAVRESHQITTGMSVLAVLIPIVILSVLMLILVVAVVMFFYQFMDLEQFMGV